MMRKQHIAYLKRLITLASHIKGGAQMLELVSEIRCSSNPVYQLIRDIVCDSRFYCVIEDDSLWIDYSLAVISNFIDSLTDEDWQDEALRTGKKEDFLNEWFSAHLFPISETKKIQIIKSLEPGAGNSSGQESEDGEDMNSDKWVGNDSDMTESAAMQGDSLPEKIKRYEQDLIGISPGMDSESHTADAEFLKSLDPTLVELAKKIGRSGSSSRETVGKFQTASRSDISGITVGNDLNSLLPAELALLGSQSTESVFYQRYAQKRLQLFSSASRAMESCKNNSGPIYICIDTSGSMSGKPEVAAKTLALAIAILAQRDKRPVCIINYSHNVSFFVLTDLQRQRNRFLAFLSFSYSGGNNENTLFNFIFTKLPSNPKYQQFAAKFKNADLLVISDFKWGTISGKNKKLIAESRAAGMNYYGLGINISSRQLDAQHPDDEMIGGFTFLKECDYRYLYSYGEIKEYIERPHKS